MKKRLNSTSHYVFLIVLTIIGFVALLFSSADWFGINAGSQTTNEIVAVQQTKSGDEKLENYDIRTDQKQAITLVNFRSSSGKETAAIVDIRDKFFVGESNLRSKVPALKVEYNDDTRTPEVIAPDVNQERAFLTAPSKSKHSDILYNFIRQNNELIGISENQTTQLEVVANYTNPDGNLSYTHLVQKINGVPVFRGEIKAGFTRQGEMFRVINNFAPGLEYESLSKDFGNPLDAVSSAALSVNYELKKNEITINDSDSTDLKKVFGNGDWAVTAEKTYFPIEPGVARTAWQILIWKPINAYYVIVDAETGIMLWRKSITADQTQSATYNVYADTTNMLKSLRSPAPLAPSLNAPDNNFQPPLANRSNISLIGNEPPNSFNNLGWMTDNINGVNGWTDGNAVEAGLDIDDTNGVDPDGKAIGTNRVFNFNYNPPPGNPSPGDPPTNPEYRNGAVTHLFYVVNRYHDEVYKLGFTEAARNFQNDNFGRGGAESDRLSAESQDNYAPEYTLANFATPADGSRGRMQSFFTTSTTPLRDIALETDVITHEYTHGLSNRLIGNGSGLTTVRSRSMGEGWSDFYALSLLSNPSDPLLGNYARGMWVANYYYGNRSFPYALKSFTGGPNNLPHNPVTFADIDPAQVNVSDGAYSKGTFSATEIHDAGSVWCSALWEVRAQFINRLGAAAGNRKTLQLVTDGMKLSPLNPNFIQGRDAIIAAARASSAFAPQTSADVVDVREGFRIRGMGFSAKENNYPSVTEAFDQPNLIQTPAFSFADANNNGYAEPGELLVLTIPLNNKTDNTAIGTTLQINNGGNTAYGDVAVNQTVSRNINFTVPLSQSCGSTLTLTFKIISSLGAKTETHDIIIGQPNIALNENFDGVTAPSLPNGWTTTFQSGSSPHWLTSTASPYSIPNAVFAPSRMATAVLELQTPPINITSSTAKLKFKLNFNTERYDGTVLEIKIGNAAYQNILTAGGSFSNGGYNGAIPANAANMLKGRSAWTGNSTDYIDVNVNLPASASGQTINLKWRVGIDGVFRGTGVLVDDVQVIDNYTCLASPAPSYKADVSPRPSGDGFIDSDDIQQIRRFSVGLDSPYQSNEFQRADDSPRSTSGDGFVDSDDVQQARRYSVGLDVKQLAGGQPQPGSLLFDDWKLSKRTNDYKLMKTAARVENTIASSGKQVTVPVRIDTRGYEAGFTFSLEYDAARLSNPVVTIGTAGGDVVTNITPDNPNANPIGFSITSFAGETMAAGANQLLVTVRFDVAAKAPAGATIIKFGDLPSRGRASGIDPDTSSEQPTFTDGTMIITAHRRQR